MKDKKKIWPIVILSAGILAVAGVTIGIVLSRKRKVKCNSRFLFIGDSNTDGYSFANILKNLCPDATIVKRALSGSKTDWMLNQLQAELATGAKYDVITILGGSNDIYALGSTAATKHNLQQMYDIAKQSGAKVVAITPPNKDYYAARTSAKQQLLYNLVSWIKTNKTIDFFIDLHKLTANVDLLEHQYYQHMNSAGQQALANLFKNTVII